jgi:C-terminal processing protease CtpA/Prc
MATQTQTQDPVTDDLKAVQTTPTKTLTALEQSEIEQTFVEAKDFRSLGEKITSPIDSIIAETATIIDSDPIMQVSDELSKMNSDVQSVYKDIINNDGTMMKIAKSLPMLG